MNLIALFTLPLLGNAMPYVVLRNKAAKCFKLEDIKPDTVLLVHYHTPGTHKKQACRAPPWASFNLTLRLSIICFN